MHTQQIEDERPCTKTNTSRLALEHEVCLRSYLTSDTTREFYNTIFSSRSKKSLQWSWRYRKLFRKFKRLKSSELAEAAEATCVPKLAKNTKVYTSHPLVFFQTPWNWNIIKTIIRNEHNQRIF